MVSGNNVTEATPSALTGGNAFTVTWNSDGVPATATATAVPAAPAPSATAPAPAGTGAALDPSATAPATGDTGDTSGQLYWWWGD
jgi:hypothetical protein